MEIIDIISIIHTDKKSKKSIQNRKSIFRENGVNFENNPENGYWRLQTRIGRRCLGQR
jgi:hypothetical protein